MINNENFATSGTETFKISETEKSEKKDHVIINIQEEAGEGIILDKSKNKKFFLSGNLILDFYQKVNRFFLLHSKVKIQAKANFFHLLSVMINAGIPMIKALNALSIQSEKSPRLQMIIETISSDIESGESLSESMKEYTDVFSEQEIGMIKSGEASGQLSNVLNLLAKDTEKAYTTRSKIKSAMIYPIVLILLLISVITAMMIFVVPKLKSLFESTGNELPLVTRIVVGVSNFLVMYRTLILVSFLIIIFGILLFKKTPMGRYVFDKIKISLPLFGDLFKKAYLSRFARSLSNLLDSDVSIIKTIEITANSIGNEVYKKSLLLSLEDIKQGIPLAENLTDNNLFPPMLISMIDVGEKTAQLDSISAKVADFYEAEVDTAVNGITKIIEPVILILIGLSVGTIVAAIMLPIMKLSDISGTL